MGGLVSEVGGLLGGGNNNSQTTAAGVVNPLQNPVTAQQVGSATAGAQQAAALQAALAAGLQPGVTAGTGEQAQLAQALASQAAGGGPNPAQAALNQNTGTNVANQAALMAGVRGASSNPGLIARQAAQQGAATQQQAVGQGATLQAEQTLAAQNALQGLAAQQVGQGQTAANAATQGALGLQSNLIGGINSQNAANESLQANQNSANLGLASTNANNSAKTVGGLINGLGGAVAGGQGLGGMGTSGGSGAVTDEVAARGGRVGDLPKAIVKLPAHLHAIRGIYHFDTGGQVPELSSPDPGFQAPPNTSELGGSSGSGSSVAKLAPLAMAAEAGGKVPGKAEVKGNSLKNDKVPVMASAGEIILPRSVTQSQDPVGESAKFVAALLEKEGSGHSEFQSALKDAIKNRKKKAS